MKEPLPDAIVALAHCVPFHPDIYWHSMNTVSSSVKAEVCREHVLTQGPSAKHVLRVHSPQQYECVVERRVELTSSYPKAGYPTWSTLFARTLSRAVQVRDDDVAYKALVLLQYQAGCFSNADSSVSSASSPCSFNPCRWCWNLNAPSCKSGVWALLPGTGCCFRWHRVMFPGALGNTDDIGHH
jgi:hypothetical protein